ncbi:MAG: murein biosynthesis integral membrane protein MurJ [Victivallaceae bacterium]|nr:murein biosynthesis integral membrane protein MurJ [Victivallaceae bacterium]
MEKSSLLRHSIHISVITLLGRFLGLARVRLEALVLGGGDLASGWFLAFTLPNLFRRLLGEGALGQALIPLIAEAERDGGTLQVKKELAVVFAWLGIVLAGIVVFIAGAALVAQHLTADISDGFWATERIRIFLRLAPLLIPYAFFMCLVGAIGAVLNYSKVFVLPALGSLLLNLFMIGGLGTVYAGLPGTENPFENLKLFGVLVLVSGATQLVMMAALLKHYDRFPAWSARGKIDRRSVMARLYKMLLPGLGSGAVVQLSFLIDRTMATWIGAQAVPALTYVDRLIDVPIGIFAISLSSVLMASMSRSAAEGNVEAIVSELVYSLRQVFFISIPMAVTIVVFHETMIRLLCYGGNFTASDLGATRAVAYFYGAAIPVFCAMKVVIPVFLARKKMATSFYVSLGALGLNLVLNLLLIKPLQQGGIALATICSSFVALATFFILLVREGFVLPFGRIFGSFFRCVAAASVVSVAIAATGWMTCRLDWSWGRQFVRFLAAGILFVALYAALAALARFPEVKEVADVLLRKKHKKTA